MTDGERLRLSKSLTPRTNKYIPIGWDNTRQIVFLLLNDKLEVLYGGAAGGGKSEALLAAAAQFVDVPGYSALILRRSYRDLALPGALMDRSKKWWKDTDAHWDGTNYKWTFPSGATIQFGYMEHDGDELRYQSSEYQFIGFDELTQFPITQYTYMFSRLRRLRGVDIPIRMRAATNPGGVGHVWVKDRWELQGYIGEKPKVSTQNPNRVFVPAKLEDNPYLDQETYEQSFEELSEVTKAQLRHGDWEVQNFGGRLDPAKFTIISPNEVPDRRYWTGKVRHWDLAAQEPSSENPDPDWTAGCKLIRATKLPDRIHDRLIQEIKRNNQIEYPKPPYWYVLDVVRDRKMGDGVEDLVRATAHRDGQSWPISMEQERGSSGKLLIQSYQRHILPEFNVYRFWAKGSKEERAAVVAGRAGEGRYFIVDGHYVTAFLDELGLFGIDGVHDDQVDALSGAHLQIEKLDLILGGNQAEEY